MRRTLRTSRELRALLVAALLAAVSGSAAMAEAEKKHPALVDPAKARCTTCHDSLLAGSTVHSPAKDDCASCHEVKKADGRTVVQLTAPIKELCLTCHGDLTDAAEGKLASAHAPVGDSCLNCHVPHSGDVPHLLKSRENVLCGECHDAAGVAKAHPVSVERSACTSCHAAHGSTRPKLMKGEFVHAPFGDRSCEACHPKGRAARAQARRSSPAAVCYACHSDLEAKFSKGAVHTPVRSGDCVGCHDPHLSANAKLLKAKGPDLCFRCHESVAASVRGKGGHAPAQRGCAECHDPHQSPYGKQVVAPVPALCNKCHDPKNRAHQAKHLGADLSKLDCRSCHDPHGAQGGKLVLAGSAHPPFTDGSCDSCHQGGSGRFVAAGKALCTTCHSDVEEAAQKSKVTHAALEGDCTACHSPHASAQPRLVRAPAGAECISCHEDKAVGEGEVGHRVIALFGCETCHEPHGSANRGLLRKAGNELCLGCHDASKVEPGDGRSPLVLLGRFRLEPRDATGLRLLRLAGGRNHPVTGHRTLGKATAQEIERANVKTGFTEELTCLTCHDPHKGRVRQLLARGVRSAEENCIGCHKK